MKKLRQYKALFLFLGITATFLIAFLPSFAQAQAPERGIKILADNTRVQIGTGEDVQLTLKISNVGKNDEELLLSSSPSPEDWDTFFRSRFMRWRVSGIGVKAGDTQEVEFQIKPTEKARTGEQIFSITVASPDGRLSESLKIYITLVEKAQTKTKSVKLVASYPMLSGPSTSKFEFRADVKNDTGEERTINILAKGPPRWNIEIKPAFESKQISSLRLKGGEEKGIDITVTPPLLALEGEYAFAVEASSDGMKDNMELKAVVIGTYELVMKTPGDRLNTEALIGQDKFLTIYLGNAGTAEIRNINFTSAKPEGWLITFEPDRVDNLPPRQIKEVNVKIRPASKAITGDYAINLRANAEQATSNIDLRVTASAAGAWGWIGVGIVVIVLAGLAGIFWRVGRR